MFLLKSGLNALKSVSNCAATNLQQTRNTFVLRRKYAPLLNRPGKLPHKLKHRHFIYELIRNEELKPDKPIDVILTESVKGFGDVGDYLKIKPNIAYYELFLYDRAVYATPENLKKFNLELATPKIFSKALQLSERTSELLSSRIFYIHMSQTEPWVLEPWHVKVSFRKELFEVPESAIELPPFEICGPDVSLQNKVFYVTVTINKKENVNVLCQIKHWPLAFEEEERELEPLFPEQADKINIPIPSKTSSKKY